MPSSGSRIRCGPAPETKRYSPRRISAAPNGVARADTTAGVVLRQPFWDHATHNPAGQRMHFMKLLGQRLPRATSTGKLQTFKSVLRYSMDLSLVAFPEQCLWVNSVRGKGRSDFMPLCATKPHSTETGTPFSASFKIETI
jgi:hypothetical protein